VTAPPANRAAPPRPADPSAKTVCLSVESTPPVLPPLLVEPPAGTVGRPAPDDPLAYAILLPGKSRAVFLRHGLSLVLPLFTGWDEAGAFLVRARMTRCWILELPSAAAVADFLRSPPGRPGGAGELLVSVDPTDLLDLGAGLVTARELIDAVAGGRR
jgi:hypothetical protein